MAGANPAGTRWRPRRRSAGAWGQVAFPGNRENNREFPKLRPVSTDPAAGRRDDSIACGHIPCAFETGNLCCSNREFKRRNRDFAGPDGVMPSRICGALRRRSSTGGWASLQIAGIRRIFRHVKAASRVESRTGRVRRHAAITPASGRSLPSSGAGARLS